MNVCWWCTKRPAVVPECAESKKQESQNDIESTKDDVRCHGHICTMNN